MQKPFRAYASSLWHWWWILVGGVIGGGLFALSLLGVNPRIGLIGGVSIFVICFIIANYLAYRDLYILAIKNNAHPIVLAESKKILTSSDRQSLKQVAQTMKRIHGHDDYKIMDTEMRRGKLIQNLMDEDCSKCFKPRKEKGGRLHG